MRTIALRAGVAALALSVAVSGAAYAAVRAGEPSRTSGVEAAAKGTDGLGAEGGRSRVSVTPSTQKVTTETVDATDPHGSVQQESGDLSEGQSQSRGQGQSQGQSQSQGQAPAPSASSESAGGSGGSASGGSAGGNDGSVGDDVWAKLAQCESGGNPATNTGNGFYGMYQFTLETWQSLGGTGYPYEADAATQTAMAKKLQAQAGWGQWPGCADKLGLR